MSSDSLKSTSIGFSFSATRELLTVANRQLTRKLDDVQTLAGAMAELDHSILSALDGRGIDATQEVIDAARRLNQLLDGRAER